MGQFFLFLAWCTALALSLASGVGQRLKAPLILGLVRPLAWILMIMVGLSFASLILSFVQNDFYLWYVAQHSCAELPLIYRITATWGGHEGSLLLWVTLLNGWFVVGLFRYRRLALSQFHSVAFIQGLINIGFLTLLVFTSNPFWQSPQLLIGQDLNPLLQDPGLVSHPPMLYLGYVGYASVYVHTIAALLNGRLDEAWLVTTQQIARLAWAFLTIGITLGSWWAYRELGWGGYWFWDPVENAALMPWLTGSALLHLLMLVRKTGQYRTSAVILIILAFGFSIFGTFLVRSGVSISVHTFAHDPMRGSLLLGLLAFILLGSFTVMLFKMQAEGEPKRLLWLSYPQLLLIASVCFLVLLTSVVLGTLYPIVLSAFGEGNLSVGAPYYEMIFIPLGWVMLCMISMIGIRDIKKRYLLGISMVAMSLTTLLLLFYIPFVLGPADDHLSFVLTLIENIQLFGVASLGLWLGVWMALRMIHFGIIAYQRAGWRELPFGMLVAHGGLSIFTLGIILSSVFSIEQQVILKTGEQVVFGGATWVLKETYGIVGPNYRSVGARVEIQEGQHLAVLYPEKRIYTVSHQVMTDADMDASIWRDLFVALGEPEDHDTWSLRLSIKPFIRWIWIGALMMALGGCFAAIRTVWSRR